MRMMSFALTTAQIRDQTKTVTRRTGWTFAKPGDVVQPIEKGQGLKKGETVTRVGPPIRLTKVTREQLRQITATDVVLEGFAGLTPGEFIRMFCAHNGVRPTSVVTRIEFVYLEGDS